MAKGDDSRTRNQMDTNNARGEQLYNNANQFLGAQGQQFQNDYGQARQSDEAMRNSALSGYQNFADTGGYGPTAISAMRSRGLSPVRAAYSNANREMNRNLPGNNPAGRGALISRMAREQGQLASDAATNTEANLGQMIQQGKLAGLGGINQLYGTTPGASSLFSNNVLQNANQGLNLLGMENQRMQNTLNTQLALTKAPGRTDSALSQVGQLTDIGNNIFRPKT